MARPTPHRIGDYRHTRRLTTRWMDNDAYGHMNNVVHYSLFDTVVNSFLIERGVLDIAKGPVIGLVVETGCHYFAPLGFPNPVTGALRVAHLGRSSVRYEVALFDDPAAGAAAQGHFVHVYVERESQRPVSQLPAALRQALEPLLVPATTAMEKT
ncbi:MAG TPA: thioesterase family protein [Usitatibacter sp.]|nr:thioesterase family protein [Usitatibacter sp.]